MHKQQKGSLWLATFLTVVSLTLVGQTPATRVPADTSTKPRVLKSVFGTVATDSVPVSPNSSKQKAGVPAVSGDSIRIGESVMTPGGDSLSQGADTVQLSAKQNAAIRKIIPRKATLRALMLPGLGQAYNRQYYKIPFVYAGFGVIVYNIISFTDRYNQFLRGYSEAYNLPALQPGQTTYPNGLTYKGAIVFERAYPVTLLKRNSDQWRRYRDLNIILGVLLWGLQAVEANVAAHLKTFDISDDISATWKPALMPSPTGMVPGVRLTFNFNH
ncbi:MAG: hypothetical protein H7Z72_13680 [Bacteroidetes bacterium]|nr:hypothetical protein [Fibrella sp.]